MKCDKVNIISCLSSNIVFLFTIEYLRLASVFSGLIAAFFLFFGFVFDIKKPTLFEKIKK